jgi:hypothetical protein
VTDAEKIETAKQYLRRTKKARDLKEIADQVAISAFEEVTITGNSIEGGQASGEITFPKMAYLRAIEELLIELDPSTPQPPADVMHNHFGFRMVQT